MQHGRVDEIWRYPVKSMGGERLPSAHIHRGTGITGDRAFAIIDSETQTVASAKHPRKWSPLLGYSATYKPPHGVHMTLSDGTTLDSNASDVDARLSASVGRPVRLSSQPPAQAKYEELGSSGTATAEPLAVGSGTGTFFDFAPIHFVTTATLARMRELLPDSGVDRARFRPNIVIDTGPAVGFVENEWNEHVLAIGPEVKLYVMFTCPRCVMTTLEQPGLPAAPEILRTAAEHNMQPFPLLRKSLATIGMYANVITGGTIKPGDDVRVESKSATHKLAAYAHAIKRAIRRR